MNPRPKNSREGAFMAPVIGMTVVPTHTDASFQHANQTERDYPNPAKNRQPVNH
jgi:hypothetical protein